MSNKEEMVEKIKDALHFESGLYDMMAGGKMYAIDLNRCKDKLANKIASLFTQQSESNCTGKCTKCDLDAEECNEHDWPEHDIRDVDRFRDKDSEKSDHYFLTCPMEFLPMNLKICKKCSRHLGLKESKVMCKKVENE